MAKGNNMLPLTDIHIHTTAYRTEGMRPEVTVAAISAHYRRLGYHAIGVLEHLNDQPHHPARCIKALVQEARALLDGLPVDAVFYGHANVRCFADHGYIDGLLPSTHAYQTVTVRDGQVESEMGPRYDAL
jgi:hypothetical protein